MINFQSKKKKKHVPDNDKNTLTRVIVTAMYYIHDFQF